MDRAEARRRRRRKGHIRLAVAAAVLAAVIVAIVLLVHGCGGDETAGGGAETASPRATAAADVAASPDATNSPRPVATKPPLVGLGDTVRFETPEGAVVRVTVDGYADPGDAPAGATADPGERLVSLELSVRPEGASKAEVSLPFAKAESFLLIAEDDSLTIAQLAGVDLLGAALPPGETVTTTLAFSVGQSPPVRFVCTPVKGSVPASATWKLVK